MNFKDEFSKYQSEPDPAAWAHYQSLKKKKKEKRGFFFFFWTSSVLFIGLGLVAVMFTQYNKSDTTIAGQHADTALVDSVKEEVGQSTNDWTDNNTNYIVNNLEENAKSSTNTINVSAINTDKPVRNQADKNSLKNKLTRKEKTLQNANNSSFSVKDEKSIQSIDFAQNLTPSMPSNKVQLGERKQNKENAKEKIAITDTAAIGIIQKEFDRSLVAFIPKLKWTSISSLNKTIPPISFTAAPIIKKYQPKKNTLKITAGYADGFINGFTLAEDQPVDKRGFAVEASYYRNLSKLVGLGLSVGYMQGIDKENPQLTIKDKETIAFIHANFYLFLVNERRHRLYGKIGAGPTITDRILGAFFIDQRANTIERIFQINTIRSIGVSVEGAYEFQVNPKLWIGTNYTIITHNDGGWYVGLSINRKF